MSISVIWLACILFGLFVLYKSIQVFQEVQSHVVPHHGHPFSLNWEKTKLLLEVWGKFTIGFIIMGLAGKTTIPNVLIVPYVIEAAKWGLVTLILVYALALMGIVKPAAHQRHLGGGGH